MATIAQLLDMRLMEMAAQCIGGIEGLYIFLK